MPRFADCHVPEPRRRRHGDRLPGQKDADIALPPAHVAGGSPFELGLPGLIALGTGGAQSAAAAYQTGFASTDHGNRPFWLATLAALLVAAVFAVHTALQNRSTALVAEATPKVASGRSASFPERFAPPVGHRYHR